MHKSQKNNINRRQNNHIIYRLISRLGRLNTSTKLNVILGGKTLLGLAGMVAVFMISSFALDKEIIDRAHRDSKLLTDFALDLVGNYKNLGQAEKLQSVDIKVQALEAIRNARLTEDHYFWVIDSNGTILVHPVFPNLEGSKVLEAPGIDDQDLVNRFLEKAISGGGWVTYKWLAPSHLDQPIDKTSYVSLFEPWGWIIGTGVYTEALASEATRQKKKLLQTIVLFCIPIIFLAYAVSRFFSNVILEMSSKDGLTGLYSRHRLNEHLTYLDNNSHKYSQQELYVLFGDVDYFKQINDSHGHHEGDNVLANIGSLFKEHTRRQDKVFRYGGEEIVAFIFANSETDAYAIAERIRAKVEQRVSVGDQPVTMSFGLAKYNALTQPHLSINRADARLYEAKEAGRNCIICDWEHRAEKGIKI